MTIVFHVPDGAAERVAFAYSPLLEAVLSLHVLAEPKHHPLQHPFVRAMRSLPPAVRRGVGEFAFAYRVYVPDFLAPGPSDRLRDFEEELDALVELPAETLALGFLRPFHDHGGRRAAELLRAPAVREAALGRVAAGGASTALARLVFDDPKELAVRFRRFLLAYWRAGFEAEWERLEPRLADAVTEAGRRIAADGLFALLRGLSPQLSVDAAREELRRELPHDHRVEVTPENRLVLVPSFHVWPHVRVSCDEPWPPSIVYPAPFVAAGARPALPSRDLVRVLRALGDDTRLQALRLVRERPRSTQELAPLVRMSEAGLSKHLRLLADAGLVETRREGYYVLYSLAAERIETLGPALVDFLDGATSPR